MADYKKIAWSYSSISKFETCPRQWYSQYVLKDIDFVPNAAVVWGQEAHDALDKRLKTKEPLSDRFKMYEKYARAVESVEGKLNSEYEMAIDANNNRVGWWDKSAVMRGKTDVSVFNDEKCSIVDWKTGSYRPNTEELEYFTLLTYTIHPEVEKVKTTYLWFKGDGPPTIEYFDRTKDFARLEDKFDGKISKIEQSLVDDNFPVKRSGLCRDYCGSKSCKYSGKFVK